MAALEDYFAANRANWDDRVAVHVGSAFYDVPGWLAGERGARPHEHEAIGDVSGLDLVHLQCHFGLDTLTWARNGARVTGLDFSPAAIAAARDLAERAGLADRARFVESNVFDAASALAPETFDLVYVSLGALCWLPSVDRWAEQVAALLRPSGRLFLHDVHPLAWATADDEPVLTYTWFEEPEPYTDALGETYTDGAVRLEHARSFEWNHGIGEIVTAVLRHGLRLDRLEEHDWTSYPRFPWMIRDHDGQRWVWPAGRPRLPLSFTLMASRSPLGAAGVDR